jgi:hypothetical protein
MWASVCACMLRHSNPVRVERSISGRELCKQFVPAAAILACDGTPASTDVITARHVRQTSPGAGFCSVGTSNCDGYRSLLCCRSGWPWLHAVEVPEKLEPAAGIPGRRQVLASAQYKVNADRAVRSCGWQGPQITDRSLHELPVRAKRS